MRNYKIIAAATVAATLGLVAGCSNDTAGSTNASGAGSSAGAITLGGVVPMSTDPFYVSLMCGADTEAAAKGASISWKTTNNTDVSAMASNLDAVQLTKPAAILSVGLGDSSMNAPIQKAMSGGIPVVTAANPNVPAVEYALVSSDIDTAEFAKYVVKDVGNKGSFAVLGAMAGAALFEMRYAPVVEAIQKESPGVTVLPVQYTDLDRTKAASITSALIASHPDLTAVFTTTSHEAIGAASALREAGKAGQIKIYTFDATPEVIQGLKDGTISAALSQAPGVIGKKAVDLALDYVTSGKTGAVAADPSLNASVGLKILTKDNLSDADTQDYQFKATCK